MTTQVGRPTNSLVFLVGEMNGKLDNLIFAMPALNRRVDDVENEVSKIKVLLARGMGGGGVILFLITSWELLRYVHVIPGPTS